MSDEELVKMARLAQRDDRMATGALYGDLADRIEALIVEKKYLLERVMEQDDLIEALTEQLEAARADAKEAEAYAEELEAKLAEAVEALRKLHHAVCGETGIAACVRLDSGLAYPWPALDEADEMTRTTLAEIEGEKT
jgi:DNA repair exonuclease SbcCD ATPase subunit